MGNNNCMKDTKDRNTELNTKGEDNGGATPRTRREQRHRGTGNKHRGHKTREQGSRGRGKHGTRDESEQEALQASWGAGRAAPNPGADGNPAGIDHAGVVAGEGFSGSVVKVIPGGVPLELFLH